MPSVDIRLLGALDGIDIGVIHRLARSDHPYPLHAKLADGATVDIPMNILLPMVTERAHQLTNWGAQLVVVLCAGGFPELDCRVPVLLPGKLVPAVVGTLTRTRRIGVVTPISGQVEAARAKWQSDGFWVHVAHASPYQRGELRTVATELADPSLELVVLDCMGHGTEYQRTFAHYCGRPTILAQTLVARVTGEFFDGCSQPDVNRTTQRI